MADLSVLRLRVQRFVTDCPAFIIDTALNDAARKFLDKTLLWKVDAQFSLSTDQKVYEISSDLLPINCDAVQVTGLKLDVDAKPLAKNNDGDLPIGLGKPCAYFCTTPNELRVGPTPAEAYDGLITIAIKPSIDKMTVPDFLLSMSGQHIAHGAIGSLKMHTTEKWYDPEGAAWHKQQFEQEIDSARKAALKGFASANISASPTRFI